MNQTAKNYALFLLLAICLIAAVGMRLSRSSLLKRRDPDMRYLVMVGQAGEMREQGDFVGAARLLRWAIKSSPMQYGAYLSLGDTLLKSGDTNAALSNYELALMYCGKSPTNALSSDAQRGERLLIEERIANLRRKGSP